jgi:exonuclease VII small subunit
MAQEGKHILRYTDLELTHLLQLDPELEAWRALAAEWLQGEMRSTGLKRDALDKFLAGYIHGFLLPREPSAFLRRGHEPPSFYDELLSHLRHGHQYNNYVHDFLNWVLQTRFSAEDDQGFVVVPHEFRNPVPRVRATGVTLAETIRTPLPYRYVRELREILCPPGARHFSDWTWAQQAFQSETRTHQLGDWFEVDPGVIDEADPDCKWRKRKVAVYRKTAKGRRRIGERTAYELWCPARAVALYVKLELPLRTFQVRMLDSGEADTWRYEGERWQRNDSPLAQGTEKRPHQTGVFRRIVSSDTGQEMTGLYVNTNKTADIDQGELSRGYVVPWQHEAVLYWLERLRTWQQKYNPIEAPTPWTHLEGKHVRLKHPETLRRMGRSCFLFRDATAKDAGDRQKPPDDRRVLRLWHKLLGELEQRCAARGETLDNGERITFVDPNSRTTTQFPLHSLRVALITAFALEGGVPLAVLSKCIAGHARILMTLYYTKAGVARVTEEMQAAEKRLLQSQQESFRRFLKDATYQQIESTAAFNDPAALDAMLQRRSPAGWVVEDKGICPLGSGGCAMGGEQLKEVKSDPTQNLYAPVPGYPREKNCVRCRFFLTGPAFVPGLVAHFNFLSSQLSDGSDRYVRLEAKVSEMEDRRAACDAEGKPFTRGEELNRLYRHLEQAAQQVDKLANDMHATLKLIQRSLEILKARSEDDGQMQLVLVGGIADVKFALEEVSEMHQLEVNCENAVIYPETDASRATLRRSQVLDAMLEMNGRAPVFFKLSPDEQLLVGNELMKFIAARVGSLRGAVGIAEGLRSLQEIGLLEETTRLLEDRTGQPLLLGSVIDVRPGQLLTGTGGEPWA